MAGIDLQHNLGQSQILSPQMRQSLEVLQANSLELGQILQQAIAINPVLEIQGTEELFEDFTPADAEHDMETLSELDDDFRELQITERRSTSIGNTDDEARREHMYNSIVAPETLQQHLLSQLAHSTLNEEMKQCAIVLIGYLDDRGFLDTPLEKIAQTQNIPLRKLEKAKISLQGFDPPGVAADDLRESLLIQLSRAGKFGGLEYRIVDEYLYDLARKKIPDIARRLGVTTDAVNQAAAIISNLNPDPGAEFDATSNPHITPDIIIQRGRDGSWQAQLTNDNIPDIAISNAYKELMASTDDNKARQYLRDQIRDGKLLIRALSQRQETLYQLALQIIQRQPEYLTHGLKALKPMTMNEVAESIQVHPATISRAVAGKFLATPQGIIELRNFFTSGYQTQDGQEVSNSGVREKIQSMIAAENPRKPLSDSAIEKQLKAAGLQVARRTVAKYRDQLNILPSHLRKQF